MKNKLTPSIRFENFIEEWKQYKLSDVSTFINGRAYKQDELLDSGKYKVLRVGNFYTNKSWYYSDLELDEKFYAKKNDLLYTWSATFGPHIWTGDKVIYHYHIWKVALSEKVNKQFMLQLFEYDKAKITNDKNGSTMVHITKKGMEDKEVLIPSIEEQNEIGNFLKQLSIIITLQEKELATLKQTKQGFLQKMFPEQGQSLPQLRFPGFNDAWKKLKLEDIAEFNPKSNLPEKFEYVDLESVVGIELISHRTEHKETAPSRAQRLAEKGDIFYQTVRPYQKNNYLFDLSMDNYVFSTGYAQMRPYIDSYYLLTCLQETRFVSEVLDRCTGTSYPAINSNHLAKVQISVPTLEAEQNKIGNFFKQLDQTIALHEKELNALQQTKQAFLQKMFI